MDTETRTPDPSLSNELPENFFSEQDDDHNKQWLDQFDDPGQGLMDQAVKTNDETPPATDQTPPESGQESQQQQTQEPEPLKFDETLAEAEKQELEELNRKLGTNFESLNELKKQFKREDQNDSSQKAQQAQELVNYFDKVLQYPDELLVKEDLIQKALQEAQNQGRTINVQDPEFLEALDERIANMSDSGVLDYTAQNLRMQVMNNRNTHQKVIDDYQENINRTQAERQSAFKDKVQEAINGIYKEGTFMGVQVDKNELLKIYRNVSNRIEHHEANPEDAVQFEFFKMHKDVILKQMNKPGFQEGVKKTLEEMGVTASSSSPKTVGGNKTSNQEELNWLQRFVQ